MLPITVMKEMRGRLVREICNLGRGSATDWEGRLLCMVELVRAIPAGEIGQLYPGNLDRFLNNASEQIDQIENIGLDLTTTTICKGIAEVLIDLSEKNVDCRAFGNLAAMILTCFIEQGGTSDTNRICCLLLNKFQHVWTGGSLRLPRMRTIMLKIFERIWHQDTLKDDVGHMLNLVECLASKSLWELPNRNYSLGLHMVHSH